MDQKLLLKEKDYQLLATKRSIQFKHSFHDPLINPPKKKNKANAKSRTPLAHPIDNKQPSNSVLSRVPKSGKPVIQQKNQIEEEVDSKIQVTPWVTILNFFVHAYDYKKEPLDTQIANPFGSQGVKAQQQQRGTQSTIKQKNTISLRTYIKILQNMKRELRSKWDLNDKVGSLQIAIQACKLLHDTSNAKFHALKFAYVMEIIEQFGINVFKRIKSLSFPHFSEQKINQLTIKDLEGANIPQSAQQICRNWLLKISSIRQLIPRTLIQTTLLRLHFFLDNGVKAQKVLKRLSKSNRCFGQYINCIFFCTFLIRMGTEVLPQDKEYILDILDDVFFYIKQGKTKFSRQDISYDEFFHILEPFFMSGFESLSQNLQKDKFKRFCSILPQNPHPIILKNFIQSFSPSLLIYYSTDIVRMLQKLHGSNKYQIYKILFERLNGMQFSQSGQFMILSWTDLEQIKQLDVLLDVLGPFSNIIFKNLPRYEKNKFYSLILERFNLLFDSVKSLDKTIFNSFNSFLTGILQKTEDLTDILTLEPFLQIISYFPQQQKQQLSANITQAFLNRDLQKITDPVVVHILLSLMKNLDSQTADGLALKFLQKIDFGNDIEQSLNFYTEMRASFGHLEKVTVTLIYKAAGLTFKARKLNRGRITNKLISFLQATLAFCYITVPVLENVHIQLKLYLYLSQIALANNLISQATSLIKTCITQLAETDSESDRQIYEIFFRIICFLIVMPDDPENDYLFLFNGLLQAFATAKLKSNFEGILRFQFYTKCIVYLSCQAQQRLPFHLDGVTSNDALFKSVDFRKALVERIMQMADLLEEQLIKISEVTSSQEIDGYILVHLSQCILTLISTFEETSRLKKIIKNSLKIIQKFRDRVFGREQKAMQGSFRNCLLGLNTKLSENGYDLKVQL